MHVIKKQARLMPQIVGSYSWVLTVLAGLHVMSRDFSDEFPCSDICIIHKINVKIGEFDMKYDILRFPHFFISIFKDISRTFQGQN